MAILGEKRHGSIILHAIVAKLRYVCQWGFSFENRNYIMHPLWWYLAYSHVDCIKWMFMFKRNMHSEAKKNNLALHYIT